MGVTTFPAPSTSGGTNIDIKIANATVPTMTGSVGRVTATVSVASGTYLCYQNGYTGTTWTVNGVSISAPSSSSSVISITTTGSSFIIDYTPSTSLTWTSTTIGNPATGNPLLSDTPIYYYQGRYIHASFGFSGNSAGSATYMYSSTDAINWTRGSYLPDGNNTVGFVAYNTTATSYKYVIGVNMKLHGSTDGVTIANNIVSPAYITYNYNAVATSTTSPWKFVIGGRDTATGYIYASTDGATWATRNISGTPCQCLGGGNSSSNFLYHGTTLGSYLTSTDSVTWTGRTAPVSLSVPYYVGYVNSLYWMSSQDGIFSSTDAITWTLRSSTTKTIDSLVYRNSAYWAVDSAVYFGGVSSTTSGRIWKSTDGTTWTVVAAADRTVGLTDTGTTLVTHTGNYNQFGALNTTYPKVYTSTTGNGFTAGAGQITLVPVTSTPVTAT